MRMKCYFSFALMIILITHPSCFLPMAPVMPDSSSTLKGNRIISMFNE